MLYTNLATIEMEQQLLEMQFTQYKQIHGQPVHPFLTRDSLEPIGPQASGKAML